jgi:hypothetical protein
MPLSQDLGRVSVLESVPSAISHVCLSRVGGDFRASGHHNPPTTVFNYMFKDFTPNPENILEGFMMSDILEAVCSSIYLSA